LQFAKSDGSSAAKLLPNNKAEGVLFQKNGIRIAYGRLPGTNHMNERQVNNDGKQTSKFTPARLGIPIEFAVESPLNVPVKILPQYSMNHPSRISEKSIIPALFQIAARADDVKPATALRNVLALKESPLSEKLLDREKLEEILKAIAKRKKATRR
jgi:hypothetical protein